MNINKPFAFGTLRTGLLSLAAALALLGPTLTGCGGKGDGGSHAVVRFKPGATHKEVQAALIAAKPGDTLHFEAGKYDFESALSLQGTAGIVIRGEGKDKTVLSFAKQTGAGSGAEGLLIKADQITIQDLAVEDTKGDCIKLQECNGVTLRNVRVEWTGPEDSTNGAYGLYPVTCKNILIDGCEAYGASDAGVYVGQSENIVVRNCRAERNVAGIEIENSKNADVYNNHAENNTGGILVFDLPDLPVKQGGNVRVFNNKVLNNNHANFAPAGNIVAQVPAGTGIMVMTTPNVEIFGNTITNHNTMGTVVVSYVVLTTLSKAYAIKDAQYNPFIMGVSIHDNQYSKPKEAKPDLTCGIGQLIYKLFPKDVPDIMFDGIIFPEFAAAKAIPDDKRICIRNNPGAVFASLDAANNFADLSTDAKPYDCALQPLPEIKLADPKPATTEDAKK